MMVTPGTPSQECPAVREHAGVVVGVGDLRAGIVLARELVHVSLRRQARPDVHELADAALGGEVADGALEELAVLQCRERDVRRCPEHEPGRFAVGRVIVFPAEVIVVHAGDAWPG